MGNEKHFRKTEMVMRRFWILLVLWGSLSTFVSWAHSAQVLRSLSLVPVRDPGFTGLMSRYETTNDQYCQYLNAALAGEIITVDSNIVYGTSNAGYPVPYFDMYPASFYSQIIFSDDTFSVRALGRHPVVEVSWYGATAFAAYYRLRLPTEWEWQAVADYDGTYRYGCGITINRYVANYGLANPLKLAVFPYTSRVGYYPGLGYYLDVGYGLCDLAGNVWEWTSSLYSGANDDRVVRGGSWYSPASDCTVSRRLGYFPLDTHSTVGFRVCRNALYFYVDANVPENPGQDGDANRPFTRIQQGIDAASDGDTVVVLPGLYAESIDFHRKAIHVTSLALADGDALAPLADPNRLGAIDKTIILGNESDPAVSFWHGDSDSTVLSGFTITGGPNRSSGAIQSSDGATIRHCVISGNGSTGFGGAAVVSFRSRSIFINCTIADNYGPDNDSAAIACMDSNDIFINCIIWGNEPNQIAVMAGNEPQVLYSNIQGSVWPGLGNMSEDPRFALRGLWVNAAANDTYWMPGDYHLQSKAGRYDASRDSWVMDANTSPCIDLGDPNSVLDLESVPNGGRVNIGAYGGTLDASHSEPNSTDMNWR
jgi:hypothetical protein